MNKIGIIFAMEEELNATKEKLEVIKEYKIYELKIYECNFNNIKCFLVESGIGKVNSARTTQILINSMNVDCILNIGVAGSISKDVKKCDIVIAKDLVQHDFDLTAFNREKGYIPNVGKNIKCDEYLIEKAKEIKINTNVVFGTIASGDIFISEEKMGQKIHQKFNALCVEMEGAAIIQVCYLCNIPCLVIRSISDSPYEENNSLTFDEFLKISSSIVSEFTIQLLRKIK